MKKKLTLDLDTIDVKSFHPDAEPSVAVQADAAAYSLNTRYCCTYTCP